MNLDLRNPSTFQIPDEDRQDEAHQGAIYGFQVVGNYIVTASADKTLRKWDLSSRRLVQSPLTGHEGSVLCLKVDNSPDEDVIISGSTDESIIVWKFSTGGLVKHLTRAHAESVLSLDFDHRYLVSGGKDKKVKLWNRRESQDGSALPEFARSGSVADSARLEGYSLIATLEGHLAAVNAVQIQGDTIISGAGDRTCKVWNIQTGQNTHSINTHIRGITDLHLNGRILVIGSSDNTASIYDLQDHAEKARITGHTNLVRAIHAVFHVHGQLIRVITGSYDGTVQVWVQDPAEPATWFPVAVLEYGIQTQRHSGANSDIHTYQEGRRVFDVGGQDNQVFCSGQGSVLVGWEFRSST